MKIQIKIYVAPKNWRLERITIPDKFEELKEWMNDEDSQYWECDSLVGPSLLDELHEWIHMHLRDKIGSSGIWVDRKMDNPPIMFRIYNVFV